MNTSTTPDPSGSAARAQRLRTSTMPPLPPTRTWRRDNSAALQILIFDNEPHALQLMRRSLQSAGYEIHAARTADEARCHIEAARPDVLIADARIPGFDEQRICAQVARRYCCPIGLAVILDAAPRLMRQFRHHARPSVIYDEKPVSQRRLLEHLENYFAGFERHG